VQLNTSKVRAKKGFLRWKAQAQPNLVVRTRELGSCGKAAWNGEKILLSHICPKKKFELLRRIFPHEKNRTDAKKRSSWTRGLLILEVSKRKLQKNQKPSILCWYTENVPAWEISSFGGRKSSEPDCKAVGDSKLTRGALRIYSQS